MTREEAQAYRDRWRLVKEREVEEERARSVAERWEQFKQIHRRAHRLGIHREPVTDLEVAARFQRLRNGR